VSNAREGGRHADFYRECRHRRIAMSSVFKCVLLDLERRQATTIPDDIRAVAAQLIGEES
jgi:hypothetical protein